MHINSLNSSFHSIMVFHFSAVLNANNGISSAEHICNVTVENLRLIVVELHSEFNLFELHIKLISKSVNACIKIAGNI